LVAYLDRREKTSSMQQETRFKIAPAWRPFEMTSIFPLDIILWLLETLKPFYLYDMNNFSLLQLRTLVTLNFSHL
jgi:hypothetical protein